MIYIITGPSGVGKNTIINELSNHINIHFSISHTTRLKRDGEIDGKDYLYVTEDELNSMINKNYII
jgi:guanylate kinase